MTERQPGRLSGRLIGIAHRPAHRVPMQTTDSALIAENGGVEGDHKGEKFPRRGVTLLAREAWEAALADLGLRGGAEELSWTARRANLLVEGVELPRALGGVVQVGPVVLEITYPTTPCRRMDETCEGLMRALYPEWRGGVTCRVLEGGRVAIGDPVAVLLAPHERTPRLPG
jgi:MOSC domain-containing protein YiiM